MTESVHTVNTAQKPSEVRRLLSENPFRHLPVVDGDKLVGIIGNTDLMEICFQHYGTDERTVDAVLDNQFKIVDIMQTKVVKIHRKQTVREARQLLSAGKFNSLPVVDGDKLVGIVTSTDLIHYLLSQY